MAAAVRKAARPAVERQVDTRADLDRSATIYSLEFQIRRLLEQMRGVIRRGYSLDVTWIDALETALSLPASPSQEDLPEAAAKVLRENLWELYDGVPASPPVEGRHLDGIEDDDEDDDPDLGTEL
jgi:hypothetical protein